MERHSGHSGEHAAMSPGAMMLHAPAQVPWTHAANALVGLWLMTTAFSYAGEARALRWSDLISGVVAMGIAVVAAALPARRAWVAYANSLVGLWLLLAPLVFWARSPATYVNDTLCGALLIAFSVVVPMGMPMDGPELPRGWTYNPSSWAQRAPIIVLAAVGFFASRYMASYQLGHTSTAWDPFFGAGTRGTQGVLDSEVSKMWPVSDAGLGAAAYLIEVLSGFMGDKKRWRTMPWMVAMFGILVVPLGLVSIVLIILQPLAVGTWCTLCLLSAAAMVVMIPLTLDEVVAMLQFLRIEKRERGASYWRTFWRGGGSPGTKDDPPPHRRPTWRVPAMVWGVTLPAPLAFTTLLGVWLMFAPAVFGSTGAMADSGHLVGALVIVFSVIAFAEVGRPARFVNIALGGWLIASAWLLGGATSDWARWHAMVVGLMLVAASVPSGNRRDSYGTFDRVAFLSPLRFRRSNRRVHP